MKLFLTLLALMIIGDSYARCNSQNMIIGRSSGFGLSLGGGGFSFGSYQKHYANIPVMIDGKRGCWKQKSELSFEAEVDEDGFEGEIIVETPTAEFKKINNGRVETFIKINDGNNLDQVEVEAVSYVCGGEQVLSMESFSGSIEDLNYQMSLRQLLEGDGMRVSTTFATGAAARNMRQNQKISRMKNTGIMKHTPLGIAEVFGERVGIEELERLNQVNEDIQVPDFFLSFEMSVPGADYSSMLSSNVASKIGCKKEFKEIMADFHIDSINQQSKDTQFKTKLRTRRGKKKVTLSWKKKR